MAEIILNQLAGNASFATLDLIVIEPDGIESVHIIDRRGIPVAISNPLEPGSCPTTYEFVLGAVPRFKLPLRATVTSCAGQTQEFPPLGETGSPEGDDPFSLPCSPLLVNPPSAQCRQNLSDLATLRARFVSLCRRKDSLQRQLILTIIIIVSFMLLVALGLALAATGASLLFFGFIFVAIGLALAAYGFFMAAKFERERGLISARLTSVQEDIDAIREPFDSLAAEVRQNCCPGAITVDLSPPC